MTDELGTLLYSPPGCARPDAEVVLQVMPEGRVRVHPHAVPLLAAWLSAAAAEWDGMIRASFRGLTDSQRKHLHAQKVYARHALAAVAVLMRRLTETVSHSEIDEFVRSFAAGAGAPGAGPATDGVHRSRLWDAGGGA